MLSFLTCPVVFGCKVFDVIFFCTVVIVLILIKNFNGLLETSKSELSLSFDFKAI